MLFLDKTPDLTSLDLTLYKYISEHSEAVTKMKIRELAEATHTSTTSILRFCKQFECTGFSEFRIKLQLYLKEQKQLKRLQKLAMKRVILIFYNEQPNLFIKVKLKKPLIYLKIKN